MVGWLYVTYELVYIVMGGTIKLLKNHFKSSENLIKYTKNQAPKYIGHSKIKINRCQGTWMIDMNIIRVHVMMIKLKLVPHMTFYQHLQR